MGEAVERVFRQSLGADVQIEGVKASSGINEQPFGHDETIKGAMNRLADAKLQRPGATYYVAIENGLFEVQAPGSRFFDVAWVIVEGASDDGAAPPQALAHSVGVEFPSEFVE